MAGIIFLKTTKLEEIVSFYKDLGATNWVSQPDIEIIRHDNLLIGFHNYDTPDVDVLITFFYDTKQEVDQIYTRLEYLATTEPKENTKYKIYNFFAKDPEGRNIEFQTFLHPLPPY